MSSDDCAHSSPEDRFNTRHRDTDYNSFRSISRTSYHDDCRENTNAVLQNGLLDFHGQRLTTLSRSFIEVYHQCTSLNICDNDIASLSILGSFSKCSMVEADGNRFSKVSSFLPLKKRLFHLSLRRNYLCSLDYLNSFTALKILNLGHNQIQSLPLLDGLSQLQELYLDFNSLSELPNLSYCTRLRVLDLSHNLISSLEKTEHILPPSLQFLSLESLCLDQLSEFIYLRKCFNRLEALNIRGNSALNGLQFDYRPYVASLFYVFAMQNINVEGCSLKILDDATLSEEELFEGERLFCQTKVSSFKSDQNEELLACLMSAMATKPSTPARRMSADKVKSLWKQRHGSSPATSSPSQDARLTNRSEHRAASSTRDDSELSDFSAFGNWQEKFEKNAAAVAAAIVESKRHDKENEAPPSTPTSRGGNHEKDQRPSFGRARRSFDETLSSQLQTPEKTIKSAASLPTRRSTGDAPLAGSVSGELSSCSSDGRPVAAPRTKFSLPLRATADTAASTSSSSTLVMTSRPTSTLTSRSEIYVVQEEEAEDVDHGTTTPSIVGEEFISATSSFHADDENEADDLMSEVSMTAPMSAFRDDDDGATPSAIVSIDEATGADSDEELDKENEDEQLTPRKETHHDDGDDTLVDTPRRSVTTTGGRSFVRADTKSFDAISNGSRASPEGELQYSRVIPIERDAVPPNWDVSYAAQFSRTISTAAESSQKDTSLMSSISNASGTGQNRAEPAVPFSRTTVGESSQKDTSSLISSTTNASGNGQNRANPADRNREVDGDASGTRQNRAKPLERSREAAKPIFPLTAASATATLKGRLEKALATTRQMVQSTTTATQQKRASSALAEDLTMDMEMASRLAKMDIEEPTTSERDQRMEALENRVELLEAQNRNLTETNDALTSVLEELHKRYESLSAELERQAQLVANVTRTPVPQHLHVLEHKSSGEFVIAWQLPRVEGYRVFVNGTQLENDILAPNNRLRLSCIDESIVNQVQIQAIDFNGKIGEISEALTIGRRS